ncbi:ArsC/Spx/MgsR family protein [Halomonas sp. E19]|uniref:ArsC/Spx/MgsR family protein n=1 Tax=Halomonas sp. E19 TaxID=3397247 RepID=UPI00403376EA
MALLEERGADVTVRRYLDEPLSEDELRDLMSRLDADGEALVRTQEPEWQQVEEDNLQDQEQVIRAIVAHPKLLERPIADDGKRAVIGRPPRTSSPCSMQTTDLRSFWPATLEQRCATPCPTC